MQTSNFTQLIRSITGRDFSLSEDSAWEPTGDLELVPGKRYLVYRVLPLSGRCVSFKWTCALDPEKVLRSFVTAFCSGYREPDPAAYGPDPIYTKSKTWEQKTEAEKEAAYGHHPFHMKSKQMLLKEVEANFNRAEMRSVFMRYGFYFTNYGVGICSIVVSSAVNEAVDEMRHFLAKRGVGFTNEFSKAGWVFRFRLGLSREIHAGLLGEFSANA